MTVENRDFGMVAGDSKTLWPTGNDEGGVRDEDNGGTVDLTGASVEWVLAASRGGDAVLDKSVSGGGVTVTDAAGGVFKVQLDPGDTEGLSGRYWHEAEVTDSSGEVSTVWTGTVTIDADTA